MASVLAPSSCGREGREVKSCCCVPGTLLSYQIERGASEKLRGGGWTGVGPPINTDFEGPEIGHPKRPPFWDLFGPPQRVRAGLLNWVHTCGTYRWSTYPMCVTDMDPVQKPCPHTLWKSKEVPKWGGTVVAMKEKPLFLRGLTPGPPPPWSISEAPLCGG